MTPAKSMKRLAAGLLLSAFAAITPAAAQDQSTPAPGAPSMDVATYSATLHLAYVQSPSAGTNDQSLRGLRNLGSILQQRTSLRPASDVIALDLENDSLDKISCFPFIYYPVTSDTQPLSAQARAKLQSYIDNGGMVLIDTQDYGAVTGPAGRDLSETLGKLNLRPLVPLPQDHTLTRAFYLTTLPGTTNDGTVWVEQPGAPASETVSSVIIGNRNWAGAWAGMTTQDMSRDQDLAFRSGVNFVMYALTGNYKSDQTFVPSILERLGK